MNAQELARAFSDALEAGAYDTAASYLADNFQVMGTLSPEPYGAREWMGLQMAFRAAAPDFSYNFKILGGDENTVQVSTRFSGTHTGDLDLSALGIGVIPATGVAFSAGEQTSEGRTEGGKIVSIHLHEAPNGGLIDMLRQLGVEMPG